MDDPLLNQVFAERYRIECLLGSGGMGKVYRATHLAMGKHVALKIMTPEGAEDPDHPDRFEREAAASAKLRHPNTIQIFDYGKTEDGRLFLAMEYLAGETLGQRLARERALSPAKAVHVLSQVLRSLREAHAAGIIHRDLKPENIFLVNFRDEPDFVKVLDFGIAKFTDDERIKKTLTASGFVCGTPLYSAPEQALGYRLTPAADLYALGVILYEMLSGLPPFKGADAMTTVMMHVHMPPPPLPASVRACIPDGLSELLSAMLDKAPSRRPASASEVLRRLAGLGPLSETVAPREEVIPPGSGDATGVSGQAATSTGTSGNIGDDRATSPPDDSKTSGEPASIGPGTGAVIAAPSDQVPTAKLPRATTPSGQAVRPLLGDLLTILAVILLIGLGTLLLLYATGSDSANQTPAGEAPKQESPKSP